MDVGNLHVYTLNCVILFKRAGWSRPLCLLLLFSLEERLSINLIKIQR